MARRKADKAVDGAQRLTLRELEVFRSVIVWGKTTAAAQQLGISQPAVSRALRQLEVHRGETLFRREGHGLVPTAEALALNQELEPIFEVLSRIASPGDAAGRAPTLRIYAPATYSHHFLPRVVADFLRSGPPCVVHVEIGSTLGAVASVASGLADVGFTNSHVSHAGVRLEPFHRTTACCVFPSGHRLQACATVTAQDLAGEPFIALARRFSSRGVIDRLFQQAGIGRNVIAEAATAMAAAALVREGLGVAILNPFPIALDADPDLVFRPFAPRIEYESSFILPVAPPKPEVQRFLEAARARVAAAGEAPPKPARRVRRHSAAAGG